MPENTQDAPATIPTDRTALFALIRFCLSIGALVVLAIADLNNSRDSIPTIVYLLIGGLNGVDIYNLVKSAKKD